MPKSFLINRTTEKVDERQNKSAAGCRSSSRKRRKTQRWIQEQEELSAGISSREESEFSGGSTASKSSPETVAQESQARVVNDKKSKTGSMPAELCEVVRADHDYIDLLVKVKDEPLDGDAVADQDSTALQDSRPLKKQAKKEKDELFNLSQLADVSLAAEGKLEDVKLSAEIEQVRAANGAPKPPRLHPQQASQAGSRTMQIVLPENASRIIIYTNGDNNNSPRLDSNRTTTIELQQSKKLLKQHIFQCADCGKKYSTSSNLARHRQTHRSVTDKKAKKCPHCGKVYVSMPAYSMHLRTHNQNCKCSICGKAFSRPWLLQGHIRTHTGERPFSCHICSKAFADKSNLRAHVQTHSNSKPFTCQKCGKTFALKSYLYKHEEAACTQKATCSVQK